MNEFHTGSRWHFIYHLSGQDWNCQLLCGDRDAEDEIQASMDTCSDDDSKVNKADRNS